MTRGFTTKHIRLGYAGAHHAKRADSSCSTGGFYTSPTNGQSLSASSPLNISWDTSCLDTTAVDIYLYAPGTAKSLIHEWENVKYAPGSYMATLEPQWWNSTSSVDLQLSIVQSGTPVFLSPLPAGPVFNATYSGSPTSDGANDSGITNVGDISVKHGISAGDIAAAVIIPLLLIIGLGVGYYLKVNRAKGREERKRWSEAVDRRMSTMSTDWKPMSAASANAVIRNSLALSSNGGNRASAFSFGAMRPSSEYVTDGGHAGIGTKGMYTGEVDPAPQMSQLRSGPRPAPAFGERVSRVSFATDTRPSTDRRTIISRAYHNAFVPSRSDSDSDEMSPTQTQGPFSLSQEDINARVSGGDEVDDYMPALSLMRTGAEGPADADDFILSRPQPPALPTPPTPTHQVPKSPMMDMPPMPAHVMSPDELLRAYATRKVTSPASSPSASSLTYPASVATYNSNGMRVLYSPTTPGSAPGSATPMARDMHNAYAYNEDDNEDAYGGTTH